MRLICCLVIFASMLFVVDCRNAYTGIRSDAVETYWPSDSKSGQLNEEDEPGWMRQQLYKIGQVASNIGNTMGEHATKITAFVDKICEIIKTVIPLMAAVCHVGQFRFCTATEAAPDALMEAIQPVMLDLNDPDR